MPIKKEQLDKEIANLFPIQVGQTYMHDGQEVVVLEKIEDGFKVRTQSNLELVVSPESLKTQAELALEKSKYQLS